MKSFPRWLIVVSGLAMLALIGGGYWFYTYQENVLRQESEANLHAAAQLKVNQIAEWRSEQLRDAAAIMESTFLTEAVERYLTDPQPELAARILSRFRALQELYNYREVMLVDPEGQVRLSLGKHPGSLHRDLAVLVAEALREKKPTLSDLHIGPADTPPHSDVVAPLFSETQKTKNAVGAVIIQLDARQFLYPLIQFWPTPSRSAETLLVRRDGDAALFLNDLRHQPDTALKLRIPLSKKDVPAIQAVLGKEGVVQGKDYRGVEVLSVLKAVPNSPWFMVAKVDEAEALSHWRFRSILILALFGGLLALLVTVVGLAWQKTGKAYYKKLFLAEQALRRMEEGHRVTLMSVGDGIISTDQQGRVELLNPVAEALTGWRQDEALGRPLEEVFRILNEETHQPVENPVSRVLREGLVVGLANHTVLVAKDGTERPIADSGAPIRDVTGTITGVVLVFHDQTQERAAEKALRHQYEQLKKSERKAAFFAALVERSSLALGIGYPDGRLGVVNQAFCKLTGYSLEELQTLNWAEVLTPPEWRQMEFSKLEELNRTGQPVRYEKEYIRKDGSRVPIELLVHLVRDESGAPQYYYAFVNDITERKQARRRIQHLNRVLRSIREVNQLIVHEKNPQRLIQEACKLLVDNQGYGSALIIVADDADTPRYFAEAGSGDAFGPLAEKLNQGELPPCCAKARFHDGVFLVADRHVCSRCPLAAPCTSFDSMCIRLRHEQKTYGYLAVAVPKGIASDEEEISLFAELADDMAFALRGIELAEQAGRYSEALRLSEEKYRSLVETISEVIYELDSEGVISYVSPVVQGVLGYEPEEVIGKTLVEFVHLEDRELVKKNFNDLKKGVEHLTEYRLMGKSGEIRWIQTLAKPKMKGTLFAGARGVCLDITKRKGIEEALQKRVIALTQPLDDPGLIQLSDLFDMEDIQRIQDAFAEATGVASIITTPDGTPVTNPSNFCRLCKDIIRQTEKGLTNCFKSDAEIGRYNPSGPIIQPCLSGGLWDAGASITIGGKHVANWLIGQVRNEELDEYRMQDYAHQIGADPQEFAKALAEVPVMSKEQFEKVSRALFCFANELSMKAYQNVQQARFIADRQKAEALRMRLVTAIEQAAEGVIITDADGTIQYVNPALENMTGYDSAELVGNNPRVLKSGHHDHAFYQDLWETITRGEIWKGRFVNKKKDGSLYHEDATISPVREVPGKIVNFVAVKRDITEHLELTKQLQQAQKMEAVGTLAGGIAHDFNNLLQAVLGYSELVLADEDLPGHLKDDLQKILAAGKSGADLVQRLLTFSRKAETKPLYLDLNQRIRQTRKFLERTIPKMIDIELILADELAAIHADPTQMDQVIMNLAVNARDAMPEGGRLMIRTENVVLDDDYARSHLKAKPGGYVLLEVSDTGLGMDAETLEHIFEPFYTTKGPGEGTGLGLAMVYGIVQQHGGFINCYSEIGYGTTFKIYLPSVVSEPESEEPLDELFPQGGTETVLLVDDEEVIRNLGERILTKAGYTVLAASDGQEALAIYKKEQRSIALVILDLIMPVMGGKMCLEEILKICPQAKVLIASGYSIDGPTKEAVGAGAKGFIHKPYEVRQMLQVVREVIDEK